MQRIISKSRPTFVRLDDEHHELLQSIAESEGTTISALLRRAAIQVFSLPTGSGKTASVSEEHAEVPTPANGAAIGVTTDLSQKVAS